MKTVELASRILTQLGFYQEPSRELGVDDRRDNIVHLIEEYTTPQTNDGCGNCHACLVGVKENGFPITSQRMILCSDCGNKRCPKASNHRHQCTGSNEPNQRGSIYTTPQIKPLSDAIQIVEQLRVDADLNYKDYENTYADGWDDAFNEILSALYKKDGIK